MGRSAATWAKAKEISTVGQLLDYLPRTYLDPTRPSNFDEVDEGEDVVVVATVMNAKTRPMRQRRGSMFVATIQDEQGGELDLTFLARMGTNAS
ncbi:hypothetical protein [Ornithinimicrobium sp. INDO-MA30-4]|uniref:hypothetical protein n=1 Tax=Ornithinimicrobium sp. INDO-MA30-4 TaxID=2908651 RepID=UPI001F1610EB|nr:hypothetical protein [Ornithinimicrobium sp. INDO-MA30-4]UJH70796.1 hypothetical protein L0A91_01820 [Ornithinimicrobium sp. INDO-MA30-4]